MRRTLTIVADAHIWGVESAFSSLPGYDVDLRILESHEIDRQAVRDADILLTRSSTRVDAELLAGSSVRFAGTATIGDDHYDKDYLAAQGIAFANAAGSSTGSVVEYMLTVLLYLHTHKHIDLRRSILGIIGVGRIGGRLAERCRAMGIKLLLNDPPRARRENSQAFASLDELLARADILTLHTPLIRHGADQTTHLLNEERLSRFAGHVVINAARGACVDNQALCDWLDAHPRHIAVLDCWEKEPYISGKLLKHPQTFIATPHIAGHSLDGKAANTLYLYRALCRWLGVAPQWDIQDELGPDAPPIDILCENDPFHTLFRAAQALYPLRRDHQTMKSWAELPAEARANAFIRYRRHYPVRRAWEHSPIHLRNADQATQRLAQAIGFNLI